MEKNINDLKDYDLLKEYRKLGADIVITNSSNFNFTYKIVKDDRVIHSFPADKILDKLYYKPKNSRTNIDYTKKNLEEQLETNSPYLPFSIRNKLQIKLFECMVFPEIDNPLTSPERKLVLKMNKINEVNREESRTFDEYTKEGTLLNVLTNLSFVGRKQTGDDLNKRFSTNYSADMEIFEIPLRIPGEIETSLLIREHQQGDFKGYIGAIITAHEGLHTITSCKGIQKIDPVYIKALTHDMKHPSEYEGIPDNMLYMKGNGPESAQDEDLKERSRIKLSA